MKIKIMLAIVLSGLCSIAYAGGFAFDPCKGEGPPKDLIRQVQSKLSGVGLYRGPIDGRYGPEIITAAQKYIGTNDLGDQILWDPTFLARMLGIEAASQYTDSECARYKRGEIDLQ